MCAHESVPAIVHESVAQRSNSW